jgi:hypothetical protein
MEWIALTFMSVEVNSKKWIMFSFELIFNKYSTILKGCNDYRIIDVEYADAKGQHADRSVLKWKIYTKKSRRDGKIIVNRNDIYFVC